MATAEPITQDFLDSLVSGRQDVRTEIVERSCARMRGLVHHMLRGQFACLGRWEDTDDILQLTLLRLHRTLENIQPRTPLECYRLVAKHIRWQLIDLCRHHFGPQGIGANHQSGCGRRDEPLAARRYIAATSESNEPASILEWTDFHECVERLPDELREVFDLIWYQQLSQQEAATLLDVSVRTIKRRWQQAKIQVYRTSNGQPPR